MALADSSPSWTINYTAGKGGTVSRSSETVTGDNAFSAVTATPDPGYHFTGWKSGDETVSQDSTWTPPKINATSRDDLIAETKDNVNYDAATGTYTISSNASNVRSVFDSKTTLANAIHFNFKTAHPIKWGQYFSHAMWIKLPYDATIVVDTNEYDFNNTLDGNDPATSFQRIYDNQPSYNLTKWITVKANTWTHVSYSYQNANTSKNPNHLDLYDGSAIYVLKEKDGLSYNMPETYEWQIKNDVSTTYDKRIPYPDTYTATFSPNNYTLTFDPGEGNVSQKTKTVTYGKTYDDLPTPIRTGYRFRGWYANYDDTNAYVPMGRDYYYDDKLSVHLSAYSDDWTTEKSRYLLSCKENSGYGLYLGNGGNNFEALTWLKNTSGAYKEHIFGYDISHFVIGDNTILSKGYHDFDFVFDGNTITTYVDGKATGTKSYHDVLPYNPNNQMLLGVEAGTELEPQNTDYFKGKIGNVVIYHDGSRTPQDTYNRMTAPAKNLTLHARWEAVDYTVKWDANGGTVSAKDLTRHYKDTVGITPPVPTRAGYVFRGWRGINGIAGHSAGFIQSSFKVDGKETGSIYWDSVSGNNANNINALKNTHHVEYIGTYQPGTDASDKQFYIQPNRAIVNPVAWTLSHVTVTDLTDNKAVDITDKVSAKMPGLPDDGVLSFEENPAGTYHVILSQSRAWPRVHILDSAFITGHRYQISYDFTDTADPVTKDTPIYGNTTFYAKWLKVQNITIDHVITGNLGDLTKQFDFAVQLNGLEANHTYELSDGSHFVSDTKGNATYRFTLKGKDTMTFKDLPAGSTFMVTEQANNHDIKVISNYSDNKEIGKGITLSTDQHTLEEKKDATITFTNSRVQAAITGITMKVPITLIIVLLGCGILLTVLCKPKKV